MSTEKQGEPAPKKKTAKTAKKATKQVKKKPEVKPQPAISCATCKYYRSFGDTVPIEKCHRYPKPYSLRNSGHWCGEHKPKSE